MRYILRLLLSLTVGMFGPAAYGGQVDRVLREIWPESTPAERARLGEIIANEFDVGTGSVKRRIATHAVIAGDLLRNDSGRESPEAARDFVRRLVAGLQIADGGEIEDHDIRTANVILTTVPTISLSLAFVGRFVYVLPGLIGERSITATLFELMVSGSVLLILTANQKYLEAMAGEGPVYALPGSRLIAKRVAPREAAAWFFTALEQRRTRAETGKTWGARKTVLAVARRTWPRAKLAEACASLLAAPRADEIPSDREEA